MARGGRREGAGRPRKDRTGQVFFKNSEDYLLAVVQGRTAPDAVRVQAAKTLIQYETAKKRAPIKSPRPSDLHKKAISSVERAKKMEFEEKAAAIRAKLKTKEGGK